MAAKKKSDVVEMLEFTEDEAAALDGGVGAPESVGVSAPLRERLGIFKRLAVSRMVRDGVDRAAAVAAVGALGDGHIMEWLLQHGPDIVAFIKLIMTLFAL